MNVLILEDEQDKLEEIRAAVLEIEPGAVIDECGNWVDYSGKINQEAYDLILLDLIVPRSLRSSEKSDHSTDLIDVTRSPRCPNFRTPAVVLTRYIGETEEFYRSLNIADINLVEYDPAEGTWKVALQQKIENSKPPKRFDFLIVCALQKEAHAYQDLLTGVRPLARLSGLSCRELEIGGRKGVIVTPPRMGLVSSAVTTAFAIERFAPKVVCMSGICGGVRNESTIYDTFISEVCFQHDAGKWSPDGFKSEHYDIQLDGTLRADLEQLIEDPSTLVYMKESVNISANELPVDCTDLKFNLRFATTSSGSAVMAEEGKTAELAHGHRKLTAFDMEIYSVYEASRFSSAPPRFFAVKTVVDDGGKNKGDDFHRVGCLLSAKFVIRALESQGIWAT
jgi:nucleoside phosphorylase